MTTSRADDRLADFDAVRGRLFGIAYRMLGSVHDAEDLVQDAWLRWQGADRDTVREPAAYLATTVTRLALNALESARARRESYVGPWLPEPVDTSADPSLGAERGEALSLAVLLLLERLTPAERAAYVLREAFAYDYREIAEVIDSSEANARQLVSRARAHLTRERAAPVDDAARDTLLAAFVAAAQSGDLAALESVLAADVVTYSDGGGRVSAARKPVIGRARVAAFLLGVLEKFAAGVTVVPVMVNGDPGFLGVREGRAFGLWTVEIGPEGIQRVLIVMNPDKLEPFVSQIGDLAGLSS